MIFKKNNVKRTLPRKIINAFIYSFLGIFLLVILFFGFSQTSTFRNLVKNKILEFTDEALIADFNLGSIEGTILTSLTLNDVSIVEEYDTLFSAKKIDISINPFPLLIQELNFTKFRIHKMNVNLVKRSSGKWNISEIIRTDSSLIVREVDSLDQNTKAKGKFPYNIKINDLTLDNVNLQMKTFANKNSNKIYNSVNFDDLTIHQVNLQANLYANINSKEFDLSIDSLFFLPNLTDFNLLNLSGNFQLSDKFAEVVDLSIITDKSSLSMSARLDSINLFSDINLSDFKDYPLSMSLKADPFTSSDLSSFLEPVNFLNGPIKMDFEAKGSFGNFHHKANLKINKTNISMEGSLLNLHTPKKLFIKSNFSNSTIAYDEIELFLKGLELPSYPKLLVENLNIQYEGEPLKFNASGDGAIDDGTISFNAFMNMYPDLIDYNYKFIIKNIDLNSTLGINSKINSSGKFSGKGFNPSESTSEMELFVYKSYMDKYFIDTLDAKLLTTDKLIDLAINADIDSMSTNVSGLLDLAESSNPIYNLKGNFNNLDLANITGDPSLSSSLNFEFAVDGHSLDINQTEGRFQLNFIDSRVGVNDFDSVKFRLDIGLVDKLRSINLQSDILDFNLNGEYNLEEAYNLFNHQINKISYSIGNKLLEINPLDLNSKDLKTLNELRNNEFIVKNNLYLDYDFEFKDFKIVAALLGRDEISVSGLGNGYIENDSSDFSMSTNIDLDYLFLFKGKEVFYISDVEGNMNIGVDNQSYSFDNIFGSFSFDSKRIVSGLNIDNLSSDIVFNESRIYYNIGGDIDETVNAKVNGDVQITDSIETITINKLGIAYNNFILENHDPIILVNTPQKFTINNFLLYNNDSELKIDGFIMDDFTQDIRIQVRNLRGGLLGKYLLGFKDNDDEFTVNMYTKIAGTSMQPIINIDLAGEDIIINDKNLGSVYVDLDYQNKNLETLVHFTDSTKNTLKPLLTLEGSIPIYIGVDSENNKVDSLENLKLHLITNNFNIASLGRVIPTIVDQKGTLNSEIDISGTLSDLDYDGYLSLKKSTFLADITNLSYGLDMELSFEREKVIVQNITLRNVGNNKFLGKIIADGEINTNGFEVESILLNMNGDIALLGQSSQESMRNLYGDLFIGTENPLIYKYKNGRSNLSGTLIIKQADLNFIPTESSYTVAGADFKYVFVIDSSAYDKEREKYDKLLAALSLKYNDDTKTSSLPKNFDLDILLRSDDISKISVVLSKALNQKLIADVSGSIRLGRKKDQLSAQGQFDILPSSMFTFYKTFRAEGDIKFTSDFTDPIINIKATYLADYINNRDQEAEPIKTAVKIKINDKVSTLTKNIATGQNPLEMKIYMGQKNIEYDVASNQYNNLDAMYFILFGTFSSDVNNADLASSAAMSVLGSTLTTMLNANFGDLINNVNFNQTGKQTRFNISGRVQKVRYTVGGSQEVFSDLSQANAKLEYLFSPKFTVRVERRDPVISSSSGNNDKIGEVGVRYRFAF